MTMPAPPPGTAATVTADHGFLADVLAEMNSLLEPDDRAFTRRFSGAGGRQPVHTVYLPADQIAPDTPAAWGAAARSLLDRHAPSAAAFAEATGTDAALTAAVHGRVLAKLASQPIEDLRADLEDGYGIRDDSEEDAAAVHTGTVLAALLTQPGGPSFGGVRIKALEVAGRRRALRSLDLVLDALVAAGPIPPGFAVTLPKVTSTAQVDAAVLVCLRLEDRYRLPEGTLRFELQVEMPQAVVGPDGTAVVARMVHASAGRCRGLHFGTYDYSAACGIAAPMQSLDHPVADHAKLVMQAAVAGTGVQLSDGSSNVLPVGDRAAVHAAWHLHARLVRRSLDRGFYQGWDLHPGQLPTRYLATYGFFRHALAGSATRLRQYHDRWHSGTADEPATARALAGTLVRGLDCGALDDAEVIALAGMDRSTINSYAARGTG